MAQTQLRRKIQRYDPKTDQGYDSEHSFETHKKQKTNYGNIMTDPRVWRGNTQCMLRNQKLEAKKATEEYYQKQLAKARPTKQDAYHRKMQETRMAALFDGAQPVAGRKHLSVQTELFLQELPVKAQEADGQVQTEPMLERPPSPVFIPAKTGLDMCTQILDNELFLFDVEVMPIIDCFNGKVIEQALLEVAQEEELAAIRAQHRAFEALKAFELAEQQRLVDQQRRKREEKETRKRERREQLCKEKEMTDKLATLAYAKTYVDSLIPAVYQRLRDEGMFLNPIRAEIETHFIPWLTQSVNLALDEQMAFSRLVQDLILDAINANSVEQAARWAATLKSPEPPQSAPPLALPMNFVPIISIEPSTEDPGTDSEADSRN